MVGCVLSQVKFLSCGKGSGFSTAKNVELRRLYLKPAHRWPKNPFIFLSIWRWPDIKSTKG